jgi:hypothetical protein
MGRFPVTLYKEQWLKLLGMAGEIRAFICCERRAIEGEGLSESAFIDESQQTICPSLSPDTGGEKYGTEADAQRASAGTMVANAASNSRFAAFTTKICGPRARPISSVPRESASNEEEFGSSNRYGATIWMRTARQSG